METCPKCGEPAYQKYMMELAAPCGLELNKTSLRSKEVQIKAAWSKPKVWCEACGHIIFSQPPLSRAEQDRLRWVAIATELT